MTRKIQVFDTTLRDGEQSPGVSLNVEEKVEIAAQLAKLRVDVIEAGFPISSPGDMAAVKAVAEKVEGPVIAALARAIPGDVGRPHDFGRQPGDRPVPTAGVVPGSAARTTAGGSA